MKKCVNKKCKKEATHSFNINVVDPETISKLNGAFCDKHIKGGWRELKILLDIFGRRLPKATK